MANLLNQLTQKLKPITLIGPQKSAFKNATGSCDKLFLMDSVFLQVLGMPLLSVGRPTPGGAGLRGGLVRQPYFSVAFWWEWGWVGFSWVLGLVTGATERV